MYVRPISTRLLRGMLTPAIRAKFLYPCRCLCRGFWQITSTAPCRRMILHFSHIGLTDGRTFMGPFGGKSGERAQAHAAQGATTNCSSQSRRHMPVRSEAPDNLKTRSSDGLVPWGEHPRPVGRHCDRELEVRRE